MLNTIRCQAGKPLLMDVTLNEKPLTMELDTGAAVSLISEATFRNVLSEYSMQPAQVPLRTYSGELIPVAGKLDVAVKYSTQQATLPLYVVKGAGQSLFGRNWLKAIRPEWESIHSMNNQVPPELAEVLKEHKEVVEGLGKLKGHKAKIFVDPSVKPRFCPARQLPYAVREKVEKELDRLQAEGIIEPVQFADWAAPVVPVMKANKKIRLCGDFKQTVNQASKLDRYPIPRIEDLFAQLAGGKLFTKLDISQAYQQLVLEEESREYVVINTHRGLFRYNRLPFGVSSAPGIFQRVMESLLKGIAGVVVYIDDILITAPTEAEHIAKIAEVLKTLQEAGLRLKREKCMFLTPSVTYLGYVIGHSSPGSQPYPTVGMEAGWL